VSVRFKSGEQTHDSEVCMSGLNLLGHAQMIELEIGSRCGGHGVCGADRVVVDFNNQKRLNPPNEVERSHLSAEEISNGMRLACQAFPNRDGDEIWVGVSKAPSQSERGSPF